MNRSKVRRLGGLEGLAHFLVGTKLILQEHRGFSFHMHCKTFQNRLALCLQAYSEILLNITID